MSALDQFKQYLAGQYAAILGLTLAESATDDARQPIWLTKGSDAWLLDPEIGAAFQIVPYQSVSQGLNESIQGALRIATLLQPRFGVAAKDADGNGAWQVGIIWLVDKPELCDGWCASIASVRKESGFSEEIGLDAVLANGDKDFELACARHGLPQLLLNLRHLINFTSFQIPGWLSANARVEEMLARFPDRFAGDPEARQLANTLIGDALKIFRDSSGDGVRKDVPLSPKGNLDEIEIRNFRSIKNFSLRFQRKIDRHTQAHIVFGPNGTGKTSIFEAICLGVGGTSKTWERYQQDPDIDTRAHGDYLSSVLTSLQPGAEPQVLCNGESVQIRIEDGARPKWRDWDGNLLGQEDSGEFLDQGSTGLGERVLKDYSTLADRVSELATSRERIARDEKAAWLRQHGLNASISRRETRGQRLIEGEIQKQSWTPSQAILDWLEKTSTVAVGPTGGGPQLAARWKIWRDQQRSVAERMCAGILIGEISSIQPPLTDWLEIRNTLLSETQALVNRASSTIDTLRIQLSGIDRELDVWGEWLIRQTSGGGVVSADEQKKQFDQIELVGKNLRELRQKITLLRRRISHLNQLKTDFFSIWFSQNPNICPTCGEDHGARGGIEKVVDQVQQETEAKALDLEGEEKRTANDLAVLEARLSSMGLAPLTQERQRNLQELLKPFIGDRLLHTLLIDTNERSLLKSSVRNAQVLPDVPVLLSRESLKEVVQKLAERSMALDMEAERLWPLPERWGKIVKGLKEECDQIVAQHLPDTIQKLWWEIAGALTSARWNLSGRPKFQVRGQGKLIIGLEGRQDTPARYLYNQAEKHLMGLAWFVVRYLTHGRFLRGLMVLDDPAQEMDQTTYRTFARFIQALLRIHEKRGKLFQMIFFLHQEDRALDLARATMGRFFILNWQRSAHTSSSDHVREIQLLSEGFSPQSAMVILGEKTAAS